MTLQQERELEEHWRLLYVGMTRAKERLVVAGVEPSRGVPENSWYNRVERGLGALGAQFEPDDRWGAAMRYRGDVAPRPVMLKPARTVPGFPSVPDWARSPAPAEPRPPRPLAPSAIAADTEAAPPPSEAMRAAARRGTLIHGLLERLAAVKPDARHHAGLRWLERSAGVTSASEREEMAQQVCGILSDRRFAALFGPGSLGEAPLAATLPDGRVIAGTIDRLLVEETLVSVIDFKTGRVPGSEDEIPVSHREQMAAYIEALRVIFPDRSIRAALLYTVAPRLYELAA